MAGKQIEGYTPDFLAFWKEYPRQCANGVWTRPCKHEAFLVWLKMSDSQRNHAMYSVGQYRKTIKGGLYVAHARTWLNQRRYEDWDIPEETGEHLPGKLTSKVGQVVSYECVNINNERNRQIAALKGKP